MPRVAHAAPVVPQPPSVLEPERPTPLPNRFIRHDDTGEEIFDISKTQAEAVVRQASATRREADSDALSVSLLA